MDLSVSHTLLFYNEQQVKRELKRIHITGYRCMLVVYHESIKRELKTKPIYECRCDERLKTRVEESTSLTCTQLVGEL